MAFVYAALLPLLVLSLIYLVLRILFPDHYRVIGATVLSVTGLTLGLLTVGFLGFDYSVEVNGVMEVLSGLWKGLCNAVNVFCAEMKEGNIPAIAFCLVVLADVVIMALFGVALYHESTEENALKWYGVKLACMLGAWILLLICEAILLLIIGVIVGIIHLFSSGEAGNIIGAILVIICICGALGGVTYTYTVTITKK